MNRVSPRVLALLAALTLMWGTNWPLFRIALDELEPWTFRTCTMLIGAVVLAAIVKARGESFAVPEGRWPALIAAATTNLAIWNIATSLAILYIPSGHASVLAYTMPLWVALLGFVLYRQRLSGRLLAAILIGAMAVAALMLPNFKSYAQAPLGLFWGLAAGLSWAIGTLIVKRTSWPGMGLSFTFWLVALSIPIMVAGAVLLEPPPIWPSTGVVFITLYIGAVPMALGMAIWFALVKLLPAQVAALSSITVPIVAIVSGMAILHEPLSPLQAVAIASTVISLWLALVPPRSVG
jgi:drug/metabolite transporter (DMT)-like permease